MNKNTTLKTVLITGAASGIGRASAQLFASKGYRVALLDLKGSALEASLTSLDNQDLKHKLYFADVSSSAQLSQIFQNIENDFGTLNAAVNNAGIDPGNKRFLDCSEEDFDRVLNINLKGVYLCMQNEIRIMSTKNADKKGAIVNLSSVLGIVGGLGTALYSASKHAVLGLTKSLAMEYARKGIRINAVCPGGVNTPMIEKLKEANPALLDLTLKMHPIGRFSTPEEIAQAIYWLCSDEASFIAGIGLVADGGYTAG